MYHRQSGSNLPEDDDPSGPPCLICSHCKVMRALPGEGLCHHCQKLLNTDPGEEASGAFFCIEKTGYTCSLCGIFSVKVNGAQCQNCWQMIEASGKPDSQSQPCQGCQKLRAAGEYTTDGWRCPGCIDLAENGCLICFEGDEKGDLLPLQCGHPLLVHRACIQRCAGHQVLCTQCMRNQGIAGSNQATEESHPAGAEAASVLVVDMSEGDQWVLAQTLAAELNFSEHIPVTAQQVLSFLRRTPGLTQENSRERFMQYYTNSWCCIL